MHTDSLPLIPPPARIQADAAHLADGIRAHLTFIEREPIAVYGRCLLANIPPSNGQVLRFINALRRYAPYCRTAARLSTDLPALRSLQDEIARQVAQGVGS